MQVQYYYSVDGDEQGPFGPANSPLGNIPPDPVTADIEGLTILDTADDHSVDVMYDQFAIGYTGYGSSEIFSDSFSGTGFSSWDEYHAGLGGVWLSEGSGVARLQFTNKHIVQVQLSLYDRDLDHDNVYWTWDAKCPVGDVSSTGGGFRVSFPDGILLGHFTDRVAFTWAGVVGPDEYMVDLDDGSWHTIGVRRERVGAGDPVTTYAISHAFGLDLS